MSHPEDRPEIKLATNYGGARPGSGRKRKPPIIPPSSAAQGVRWYCVQVEHRMELAAILLMKKHGMATALPLSWIDDNSRLLAVPQPLIPDYLFVAFDAAQDPWRSIVRWPVKRLFSFDTERPIPLPINAVEDLMAVYGSEGTARQCAVATAELLVGVDLTVLDGPFADFAGPCILDSGERVRVLLTIFGRETSIDLPRKSVEKA